MSCPFFLLRWYKGSNAKTTPLYLTSSIGSTESDVTITDLTEFELHNDTYIAFMNVGSKAEVSAPQGKRQLKHKLMH